MKALSQMADLPVAEVLDELADALNRRGRAVLVAPPGAGKTTLVPLAMLNTGDAGRILMLEPRRLAARAAAERMASLLGETLGDRVGYRIRGETKVSAATRIEVVTEGVLTRMIQTDPSLDGIGTIIFDEFHERSLNADLGLALTLEAREALRPDIRILAMSATLDAEPLARLMGGAPVIRSGGRAFPVEIRWAERSWRASAGPRGPRLEDAMAALIRRAHDEGDGDILAFLPGEREIRRTAAFLAGIDAATDIRPLFGAMKFSDQRAALAAAPAGRRKIVLATAIAETSLTVEGVTAVVDAGLARRARFNPGSGMTRLVTEPASRAEAEQRRGRAGRLAPGVCWRLWTKGEDGAHPEFAPPEIETTDLAPLALELAAWGAKPGDLAFLSPPPEGPLAAARTLLSDLGALDGVGRITPHGRDLARAPAHPRLAHMILTASKTEKGAACQLAALLEARDPLRGAGADISHRLKALAAPNRHGPAEGALRRVGEEAARLARRMSIKFTAPAAPGPLLARAYPDRIALRRKGQEARYLLSGGKGARLAEEDALAGERLLVVADLDGGGREAAARLAAPISQAEVEALFADRIEWVETCEWSRRDRRVEAWRRRKLGAISLEARRWTDAPPEAVAEAMAAGVRDLGLTALPWTDAARRLAARVEWARSRGAEAAPLDDVTLLAELEVWLAPHLQGVTDMEGLKRLDLASILRAHVGWAGMQAVDRIAPESFAAPTGTGCRIDYGGAQPSIAVRLQEMFGVDRHPQAGGEPLLVELLSPAGRPVQTTADLPGFWRTSYADVRRDMRGRYPKHPWPEEPLAAEPTRRAKPRGG